VKNNFFDAQTHTHKSGQQVVGGECGEPMAPIVATRLGPVSQGPDAWAIAFNSVFPLMFRGDWKSGQAFRTQRSRQPIHSGLVLQAYGEN